MLAGAFLLWSASALAQTFASSAGEIFVETIARGLEHPWALAFLPGGRMLVTERPGRMRIVAASGQLSSPIVGVPEVFARGMVDCSMLPSIAAMPETAQSTSVLPSRSRTAAVPRSPVQD
jgi:aldose sugar dehydrogenase